MFGIVFFFLILILAAGLLVSCICIVPQASAWIVEALGQYHATWEAGLHFRVPIIFRIAKKVSLKEQVADFEPQPVITSDNVTMMVDSVVFFEIFDARLFTYGVERPIAAIENLSATTLRNIIGSMTLDQTLTSRDEINRQITSILDTATDKWGIKVNRVEVKNIDPPRSIVEAMEKEMKAEREKRAVILNAEGEKQSAITRAEGEKEAAILKADAVREKKIREAEGEAEAVREKKIREAEGEAEALRAVQKARADGIRYINEAGATEEYLRIRSLEAAEKMADGQATKIVVPSELASLAGTLKALKESAAE